MMHPAAMKPFGLAMLDFWKGEKSADFTIVRDDGLSEDLPVNHFIREFGDFTSLERTAVEQCRGQVLDVGAGTSGWSTEIVHQEADGNYLARLKSVDEPPGMV